MPQTVIAKAATHDVGLGEGASADAADDDRALHDAALSPHVNEGDGGVGYTLTIEYVFYGFFALGLLCVLYIMAYENFRHADRPTLAARVQRLTRIAFWAAIVSTAAIAGTIFGGTLLN